MTVIVCVDNNNGMLFNNRRQSRDRFVIADILRTSNRGKNLYINAFSSDLFKEYSVNTVPDISQVPDNAYIFVENIPVSLLYDKLTKLIIYKWNRDYPSDFKFDINLSEMKLIGSSEFEGSSHIITKEEYIK